VIAHLIRSVAKSACFVRPAVGAEDQNVALFFLSATDDRIGRFALTKKRGQTHAPRSGEIGGSLKQFFQSPPRLRLDLFRELIQRGVARLLKDRYRSHAAAVLLGQLDCGL
jgi:hypothetical protein